MKIVKYILEFLSKLSLSCKSSCCESSCRTGKLSIPTLPDIESHSGGMVETLEQSAV